jgi:hypothetical protein
VVFSKHPVILEVNARLLVNECSQAAGEELDLGSLPDSVIEEWAALHIEAVWLMGVWTTGLLSKSIAAEHAGLQEEYRTALPDYDGSDIGGSPYSVYAYDVMQELGGTKGLAKLRKRLAKKNIGVILDFVPNHTARDHPWTVSHPEYYVQGKVGDEVSRPDAFFGVPSVKGPKAIAFGRDPYFPGWTDTAQLNYQSTATRKAMIGVLGKIAAQCDGVRVDMAMLAMKDVFRGTWGSLAFAEGEEIEGEFWREAIGSVRTGLPDFLFMAEAYWNLEWDLQQLGFNFTYDKTMYERLLREGATSVREHLRADLSFQNRCVRFVENHDEPAAAAMLPSELWHCAAVTVAATVPGMLLLHEAQLSGRTVKTPVQLLRRSPHEPNLTLWSFYRMLGSILDSPVFRHGEWRQLEPRPSWHDNRSSDNFLSFFWHLDGVGDSLVVINYAPHPGQCQITLPLDSYELPLVEFRDLLQPITYVRDRAGLISKGMFFDMPGYGMHIFALKPIRR